MSLKHTIRHIATSIYLQLKEHKFKGRLKYIYENHSSDKLLVVFSGFADKPVYNYIRTLKNIKCNKLFFR